MLGCWWAADVDPDDVDLARAGCRGRRCRRSSTSTAGDDPTQLIAGRGLDRVRVLGEVDDDVRRAWRAAGVDLDSTPVVAIAEVELRRWVREQAISWTRHRHGRPLPCQSSTVRWRWPAVAFESSTRYFARRMAHRIAVIGGDGIGPEVTAEALKVVRAAGVDIDTTDFDLGGARYLRDGEILSDATLDQLRGFDAILLGAVGTPEVPPGVIERGLLLKMRFDLDLYVNQRPVHRHGSGAHAAARLRRHPREHRGSLRRRGRGAAQGHAARGGDAGLGQHAHGRRACHPVRVRPGGQRATVASTSRWCTRPTC